MTTQHTLSKEELANVVVVVVRGIDNISPEDAERYLGDFPDKTLFIQLEEDQSLEFLTESEMSDLGWVRK